MTLIERIRRWFDRNGGPAADPADLQGSRPDDPGASTGLDRPVSMSGPIADPPERPLG